MDIPTGLCIVSLDLLDTINTFDVIQDVTMPSDHAAISLNMNLKRTHVITESLLKSAQSLLNIIDEQKKATNMAINSLPMFKINSKELGKNASTMSVPVPPQYLDDFQLFCDQFYSSLYELSSRSLLKSTKAPLMYPLIVGPGY